LTETLVWTFFYGSSINPDALSERKSERFADALVERAMEEPGETRKRLITALSLATGHNHRMAFDFQPVLRGDRVAVRPLCAGDIDALYEVARDPLLWEQHPERDRHHPEVFRRFFDDAVACGGALTVIERDGRVIGSSRFHGYDEHRSEVEIGWTFLARSHWGGPANRELHSLMLAHAFRFLDRVVFLTDRDNLRSQRAHEKLGPSAPERAATEPARRTCYSRSGDRADLPRRLRVANRRGPDTVGGLVSGLPTVTGSGPHTPP
jgi:N-acetyltransferase